MRNGLEKPNQDLRPNELTVSIWMDLECEAISPFPHLSSAKASGQSLRPRLLTPALDEANPCKEHGEQRGFQHWQKQFKRCHTSR